MFELDLHHVAVTVTDMEKARWFYEEVLGLTPIERPPFNFPGAWYTLGERTLHLIVHDGTRTLRGTRAIDPKDAHMALRVRSFEDTVARMQAFGVECLVLPDNLTPWAQLYVADPDGNIIEFNVERGTLRR